MNRNKTFRVISLVIVFCFILTSTVFATSTKGNKARKNEFKWNKSANYMRDKGIMKGYGNGDFGFTNYVKRGDVTVMIVRAFKLSTIFGEIEKGFLDVPTDSYFYDAILSAKHYGIAKGDGKHFNPNKYVTIGEAIALIERSVSVANMNVVFAVDIDLDKLYDDEDLDKYATRDDIAKMLYYVLTGDLVDDENEVENDVIVYETNNDAEIAFDEDDFNDAFYSFDDVDKNDKLDYVMFKLPSSSNGKLYYNYDETKEDNLLVKSNYEYYYNTSSSSDRDISKISFVPNENYDGTFYVYYTAYDEDEDSYQGVIKIIVKDNVTSLDKIKYTAYKNTKFTFDHDNFEGVFEDAAHEDFSHVKFVLPNEKYGKLYYDYASSSNYKSLVAENKEYDYDDIDKITFVPASGCIGNVYIDYTAYDKDGDSYYGEIKVIVK